MPYGNWLHRVWVPVVELQHAQLPFINNLAIGIASAIGMPNLAMANHSLVLICGSHDCVVILQYERGGEDLPGYISTGGAASEWSDGFRAVRNLKYGTSESFTALYRKLIFVGELHKKGLVPR